MAKMAKQRPEREARRQKVLQRIAQIPYGQVLSYRDLSLEVYGHPRAVMSISKLINAAFRYGGCLNWHRVVRADGTLSPSAPFDQRRRLEAEGVVFDGEGAGARIRGDARAARG